MTGTWKTDKRVTWTFVPTNKKRGLYTAKAKGRTGTAVFDKGKLRIFYKHAATRKGERIGFYDLAFKTGCTGATGRWSDSFGLKGFASLNFVNRNTTAPVRATSAQKKGTYRVVINGFKVERQTKLGQSGIAEEQSGGKGDEVFIETMIYRLKKNGSVIKLPPVKSKIMGNVKKKKYRNRVKAGTASKKHGGLKTGDKFPRDINKSGEVVSRSGNTKVPPMVVFEGTFVEGEEAVVIIPTIWEWDKGKKNTARDRWAQWNRGHLQSYFKSRPKHFLLAGVPLTATSADYLGLNPVEYRKSDLRQTRPIGINAWDDKKGQEKKGFWPRMVILNKNLSWQLKAAGDEKMFTLHYKDQIRPVSDVLMGTTYTSDIKSGDQHGDYVLYVKVERLK